jgi:hypothetical protein
MRFFIANSSEIWETSERSGHPFPKAPLIPAHTLL